ncbi:hypothetical protein BDZ89DRAFT_1137300 [Hymenopellis radicata]|nr:hypothetical protein BDZ89DRAFT_1137300 [Hymenopellis radicata]
MDSPQEMEAIEDWDTYAGASVDDEKPLLAVSTSIKDDLNAALSGEFQFDGTFAHSNVYTDAPNPCLNLDGLGSVGLPLSERDARAIMEVATAGTGVEQGLWTFPGVKVHFDNPQFTNWIMHTAVPSINTALAAYVAPSVGQYQLRSLTLRGAHADALNCYEEMREDSRQYGILSVVLPSRHIGGQIRIIHQGTTKTFNTAGNSAASTTVVGAYTGVTQSLDSIQSGYVVCLSYELNCLGESHSIPRLPQLVGATTQLRHVFRSWRQKLDGVEEPSDDPDLEDDDVDVPQLIPCLFEHTYGDMSHLKATALQGADRLMLSHIAPLAKVYGFNLHLSQVTYTESGGVTLDVPYYGGRSRYGRYGYNFYDEDSDEYDDVDADDVEMDEVEDRSVSFRTVFALDGMPMQMSGTAVSSLNDGDPVECFINGDLTDGDKESSFDRYDRESGYLTYAYKRSVLIISPKESEDVKFTIGDIRSFACAGLESSLSETPSPKENKLVAALLQWLKQNRSPTTNGPTGTAGITPAQVANILRDSADRWNDADLFVQVLQSCGPDHCISLIGLNGLISAYQAFDWNKLKDLYTEGLSQTVSNSLRGQVIDRLLSTAMEQEDAEKLEVTELDWVLNLVRSKTNPTAFLATVLIPRLHAVQPFDMPFWTAFLTHINEITQSGSPVWDVIELRQLIRSCLERIASNMPPYPVEKKVARPSYLYGYAIGLTTTTEVMSVEPIVSLFELGSRLGLADGCMPVLHRMWAGRDAQKAGASAERTPALYYSSLVPRMEAFLRDKPHLKPCLEPFFGQAVAVLLESYSVYTATFRVALQHSSNAIAVLKGFLTADRVKELAQNRNSLKELAVFVSETLRPQARTPEASTNLQIILKSCLAGLIGSFDLSNLASPYQSSGYPYYYAGERSHAGIELLKLCFTLQLPADANRVLAQFLALPKSNEAAYIKSGLVPFLKALPTFLATQKTSLVAAPYSLFAAEVVRKFTRHVLGPKPSQSVSLQELRAVGCGCAMCNAHLVPFLTSNNVQVSIREKQKDRTHLEQRLARTQSWGVTWTTLRYGSPHTLQVTKPQRMVALGQWAGNATEGKGLLNVLGNAAQQEQVLGPDYAWVAGTIAGTASPPALPLATTHVNGVAAKRPSDAAGVGQAKKPRLS